MSKRGFQLSASFLVVIILSVAVLAGGLFLSNKLFRNVNETKAQIDAATMQELESLIRQGSLVSIPFKQQKVARGQSVTYGLGILSVVGSEYFRVLVEFDEAFDSSGNSVCVLSDAPGCPDYPTQDGDGWGWLYNEEVFRLAKNEDVVLPIYFKPPKSAPRGSYIFRVVVYNGASENDISMASPPDTAIYDRKMKLILKVV